MKIKEIMSATPVCCIPTATAQAVARLMKTEDVGAIPVIEDLSTRKLVGIVTDRDLCLHVVADALLPERIQVKKLMTTKVVTCKPEDTPEECLKLMRKHQVRRIPVVNDDGSCIGLVSLADVAPYTGVKDFRKTYVDVTEPSRERRPRRKAA
jgi:CBS domain-containing protein